jgi:large subunit ribosomal protein L20
MTRVKRGVIKNKRRRNVLSYTKGFRHGRKSKLRQAREAIFHIAKNSFDHRRDKKAVFRHEWHIAIDRALGDEMSFSQFMGALRKKGVGVNKKILAHFAKEEPSVFKKIVESVK